MLCYFSVCKLKIHETLFFFFGIYKALDKNGLKDLDGVYIERSCNAIFGV